MIIQNNANKKTHTVSIDEWRKLQKLGLSRLFKVIDKTDEHPVFTQVKIPKEIKEFQESLRIKTTTETIKPKSNTKK